MAFRAPLYRGVGSGSPRPKKGGQTPRQVVAISGLAFPYDQHGPAELGEGGLGVLIALYVSRELRQPILGSRSGRVPTELTAVLMPKASVDKNHFPAARKDQVRRTR